LQIVPGVPKIHRFKEIAAVKLMYASHFFEFSLLDYSLLVLATIFI